MVEALAMMLEEPGADTDLQGQEAVSPQVLVVRPSLCQVVMSNWECKTCGASNSLGASACNTCSRARYAPRDPEAQKAEFHRFRGHRLLLGNRRRCISRALVSLQCARKRLLDAQVACVFPVRFKLLKAS